MPRRGLAPRRMPPRPRPPPQQEAHDSKVIWSAALLCDYSKHAFTVIVLGHGDLRKKDKPQVIASIFESGTGIWGNLVSGSITAPLWLGKPSILVGNSLCWWLCGIRNKSILEFDLERKSLSAIDTPVDAHIILYSSFQIIRMEDNSLGLAILSDVRMQLWERKIDSGGVAIWMLHKAIELDKLLSLPVESSFPSLLVMRGYDEDGNWIFIWTSIGVFMIQLKSMQFMKFFESSCIDSYHPYTHFYTTARLAMEVLKLKLWTVQELAVLRSVNL